MLGSIDKRGERERESKKKKKKKHFTTVPKPLCAFWHCFHKYDIYGVQQKMYELIGVITPVGVLPMLLFWMVAKDGGGIKEGKAPI